MARIDWVKQRLENWARWSTQRETGGLGYPRQSPFARMMAQDNRNKDAQIPVNDLEAAETDDAVRSLQLSQSHLYITLKWHYGRGETIDHVSRRLHKAPSTIKRHLEQSDAAIARWLSTKREAQEAAREALAKGKLNRK